MKAHIEGLKRTTEKNEKKHFALVENFARAHIQFDRNKVIEILNVVRLIEEACIRLEKADKTVLVSFGKIAQIFQLRESLWLFGGLTK